jgi:hypothetical protein
MKTLKELVKVRDVKEVKTVFVSRIIKAGELNKKLKYLLKEASKNANASDCYCFDANESKSIF